MKRILLVVAMSMTLSACSDERLYQILGSPPPQGPPTIYPMNFPVCPLNWGIVVKPLNIIIYKSSFPLPEYVMSLKKRNPERDPCRIIKEEYLDPPFRIREKDHWEGVAKLDKSGKGYFAASTYEFNLINDDSRREIERKERDYKEYQDKKMIRDGYASKKITESEDIIIVNGLKWRHTVIGNYEVASLAPDYIPEPDKIKYFYDIYEHQFDSSHTFQIKGVYDRIILSNQELLKDRRQLTRRLVEGFRYERISPEQIERLKGPKG